MLVQIRTLNREVNGSIFKGYLPGGSQEKVLKSLTTIIPEFSYDVSSSLDNTMYFQNNSSDSGPYQNTNIKLAVQIKPTIEMSLREEETFLGKLMRYVGRKTTVPFHKLEFFAYSSQINSLSVATIDFLSYRKQNLGIRSIKFPTIEAELKEVNLSATRLQQFCIQQYKREIPPNLPFIVHSLSLGKRNRGVA